MATQHDPITGEYYLVDDKLLAEDKALAVEAATIVNGWSYFMALQPHFRRQQTLTAEQRSRLAYYDDLLERTGGGA